MVYTFYFTEYVILSLKIFLLSMKHFLCLRNVWEEVREELRYLEAAFKTFDLKIMRYYK